MFSPFDFSVRYASLDPNIIFNFVGRVKTPEIIDERNQVDDFFNRLEESIRVNGIRNPILVTSGVRGTTVIKTRGLPSLLIRDLDRIIICDRNGGSRLWAAKKLGILIPCIISDFNGRFASERELMSIDEIKNCYSDPPGTLKVDHMGVHVIALPQIHMQSHVE